MNLFDGVDGHVAGAGNEADLAGEGVLAGFQHLVDKEGGAVAGGFGADQRTAPGQAFAGQYARLVTVGNAFVLAEHVADFAAAHADVAGRNVGVLAQVAIQFGHEALAETHDFVIGFAFGIEIGTAFAAADRQAGQRVFEDLLETEKLDDSQINGRMEAQAAFVGPQRAVELNAEAAVDLYLALVVLPGYPEDDLAFRFTDSFDDSALEIFGVLCYDRSERFEDFENRLMELGFTGVAFQNFLIHRFNFCVNLCHVNPPAE